MRIVIVHKPSGMVIPCAKGRMDRGGSWVEPEDLAVCIPRIFTSLSVARGWLTTWCKGKQSVHFFTTYEGEHDARYDIEPTPHRVKEEYDFQELTFKLVPIGEGVKTFRSFTLNDAGREQLSRSIGKGIIVGESADRECWKVIFEGNSPASISTVSKHFITVGDQIRP